MKQRSDFSKELQKHLDTKKQPKNVQTRTGVKGKYIYSPACRVFGIPALKEITILLFLPLRANEKSYTNNTLFLSLIKLLFFPRDGFTLQSILPRSVSTIRPPLCL